MSLGLNLILPWGHIVYIKVNTFKSFAKVQRKEVEHFASTNNVKHYVSYEHNVTLLLTNIAK
jgi:hypothetical protein